MLPDINYIEVDDLDLQDREYMNVVRGLERIDINKLMTQYLEISNPELYQKLENYFKYKR